MTGKLESNEMLKLLIYGAIGGFVGGIFYAFILFLYNPGPLFVGGDIMESMMGTYLPLNTKIMLGIIFHHISSIILGIIFGIIVIIIVNYISAIPFDINNLTWNIVLGAIWGLVVMILGQVILIPMIYAALGVTMTMDLTLWVMVFIGHLIFGAIIGLIAWFLNKRIK